MEHEKRFFSTVDRWHNFLAMNNENDFSNVLSEALLT